MSCPCGNPGCQIRYRCSNRWLICLSCKFAAHEDEFYGGGKVFCTGVDFPKWNTPRDQALCFGCSRKYTRCLGCKKIKENEEFQDLEEEMCDKCGKQEQEKEKIPDETFKKMFFSALKSLPHIPHYEEMVACLPEERQSEVRKVCQQFENEFHERVFQFLMPEISKEAIKQFIENMSCAGDIPSNFEEMVLMSPDNPEDYVQTQREAEGYFLGEN